MAIPKSLYLLILTALLFAHSIQNIISTSTSSIPHGKSLHFALYTHDIANKTDYVIVKGVTGAGSSPITSPFGTVSILHDNLTLTPDPSSEVVGISEGLTITSSFDGYSSIAIAIFTFQYKDYNGSISIVGSIHNVQPSNLPIVGGTGDFLFVKGFVTSSCVAIHGYSVVFKQDFHLFWPDCCSHSCAAAS